MIEALEGMKFYWVINFNVGFGELGRTLICTYRNKEQVEEAFNISGKDSEGMVIWDLRPTEIDEALQVMKNDGVYCVEVHNSYNSLETLAEDVVVYRLAGVMDQEL